MRSRFIATALATVLSTGWAAAHAAPVVTTDAAVVAAFQQGLTVQTFEQIGGRTPMAIAAYSVGDDVGAGARIYDQVPGFRFSSGGTPGQVTAALFELGGDLAGDARSGDTVLAPLSLDNQTQFGAGVFLEAFLPERVSSLGFWVSPAAGRVRVIFANSNFAFDTSVEEVVYDAVDVLGGQFVSLTRAQADIGGFKILTLQGAGFSIDDLSYGTTDTGGDGDSTVPEPASALLALTALATLRRRRR